MRDDDIIFELPLIKIRPYSISFLCRASGIWDLVAHSRTILITQGIIHEENVHLQKKCLLWKAITHTV